MDIYNNAKRGGLISFGSDHVVYDYGEEEVVKFSLLDRFFPTYVRPRMKRDLLLTQRFFGEYILDTRFLMSEDEKWLVKIQPKVFGHFLCKKDLQYDVIRTQFLEIIACQDSLERSGYQPMDLIGHQGVLFGCFSNIFVVDSDNLIIIDTTILNTKNSGMLSLFITPIAAFAKWRQRIVVRRFMKAL